MPSILVVILITLGLLVCLGYLHHTPGKLQLNFVADLFHRKARAPSVYQESRSTLAPWLTSSSLNPYAEANAWTKIQERMAWFEVRWVEERRRLRRMTFVNPTPPSLAHGILFAPYYTCPWTLDKTPGVRDAFDGGKFTCGLAQIAQAFALQVRTTPCVVYSFGSNNDDTFELTVRNKTNGHCAIHVFDPTSKPFPQYHFHSVGLAWNATRFRSVNRTDPQKSETWFPAKNLTVLMHELNHSCVDQSCA